MRRLSAPRAGVQERRGRHRSTFRAIVYYNRRTHHVGTSYSREDAQRIADDAARELAETGKITRQARIRELDVDHAPLDERPWVGNPLPLLERSERELRLAVLEWSFRDAMAGCSESVAWFHGAPAAPTFACEEICALTGIDARRIRRLVAERGRDGGAEARAEDSAGRCRHYRRMADIATSSASSISQAT